MTVTTPTIVDTRDQSRVTNRVHCVTRSTCLSYRHINYPWIIHILFRNTYFHKDLKSILCEYYISTANGNKSIQVNITQPWFPTILRLLFIKEHTHSQVHSVCHSQKELSLILKHMPRTYVGSTPSPPRRIRQHNGEITQGAWKTQSNRPWVMQLIVHGFPSKLAALQFEWAWQHPWKSRHLRDEDGKAMFSRSSKLNHLKRRIE